MCFATPCCRRSRDLALSLGLIFSGALITEIVFSYPGLGTLLYNAIVNGDYNLIMGITVFSIFAITTISADRGSALPALRSAHSVHVQRLPQKAYCGDCNARQGVRTA